MSLYVCDCECVHTHVFTHGFGSKNIRERGKQLSPFFQAFLFYSPGKYSPSHCSLKTLNHFNWNRVLQYINYMLSIKTHSALGMI